MSKLVIKNSKGDSIGDYSFPIELLESEKGNQAVHETIVAFQAHQRLGTASTLSKANVAGSGKKPWKQKGLGRARVGYRQNPIWRGGSVAHGPHPRKYKKKVSKKVSRLAFRRAFTAKINQDEVMVIDELNIDIPKTKSFISIIRNLGISQNILVIVNDVSENLLLASRNLKNIEVVSAKIVSTYQILRYKNLIITQDAMDNLKDRLVKKESIR